MCLIKLLGIDCMTLDFGHNDLTEDLSLRAAIAKIDFFGPTSIVPGQLTINGDVSGLVTNLSFYCSVMIDGEGSTVGEMNVLPKIVLMKLRQWWWRCNGVGNDQLQRKESVGAH